MKGELNVIPADPQPQQRLRLRVSRGRHQQDRSVMGVNLTPAIDITFNLLMFFMVATTFKAQEGLLPSKLPAQRGVLQATPLPISPIKIRLSSPPGQPDLYRIQIEHWSPDPETFLQLTDMLIQLRLKPGFDSETPVVIFADDHVPWDHVVNCFNGIRRATFGNISFAVHSDV